ncbi:hypothetical protein ACH4SP_07115 [Streptomyces sp. NPDC021093]|uniref:hypothetical protein n=1 Tax=Streptomyces sp. NPDC021093 TaxID=3365112 RepID=UPI0037BC91F0
MGSSVPVRCPACRRDHAYVPPVFPCACGAPLAPPLLRGAPPQPITHRTWTDSWVTVRCPSCGRQDQWPQPELGCGCGAVLRIPVRPAPTGPRPTPAGHAGHTGYAGHAGHAGHVDAPGTGFDANADADASPDADTSTDIDARAHIGADADAEPAAATRTAPAHGESGGPADGSPVPRPRPPFRPLTIRTARDAVTAAALYLKWLGFHDILQSPEHPASGIDLRARGLVAQVDPRTEPSTLRDVECLWLHGLNSSSLSVFFSLTGYVPEARARAEDLGVPLFVMDLTGTPQPANGAADELVGSAG